MLAYVIALIFLRILVWVATSGSYFVSAALAGLPIIYGSRSACALGSCHTEIPTKVPRALHSPCRS